MKNVIVLAIMVGTLSTVAYADDLNPPPWRGQQPEAFRTFAQWEFDDDMNPAFPR